MRQNLNLLRKSFLVSSTQLLFTVSGYNPTYCVRYNANIVFTLESVCIPVVSDSPDTLEFKEMVVLTYWLQIFSTCNSLLILLAGRSAGLGQ